MKTSRSSILTLASVAILLVTLPGCVGMSSPHPLSRRAPRMVKHQSEKMSLRPGETCAVARANEPKDLQTAAK